MTKKEQLRRRIIELIHGCEYEEAVRKELVAGAKVRVDGVTVRLVGLNYAGNWMTSWYISDSVSLSRTVKASKIQEMIGLPITLARLLKSFQNSTKSISVNKYGEIYSFDESRVVGEWLLANPDGSECTLDDQSEETREALHQLLCTE